MKPTYATRRLLARLTKKDVRTLDKRIDKGEMLPSAHLLLTGGDVVPLFEVDPFEVRKLEKDE